jgi:hypothetical protein
MPSIGSSFAERRQKKLMVSSAGSCRLWTSAQLYAALNLVTGDSLTLIGVNSNASTTNITDDNLGSNAVVATDANLATVLGSGSGLSGVGTTVSAGELLRPLGKKFNIGTRVFGDLVTLQKVQRTDMGTTQTQGVGLAETTGDGYNTYWVLTDSFARSGGASSLINGLDAAIVKVISC